MVECQSLSRADVLAALAQGNYRGIKDDLTLPSNGQLPESLMLDFESAHSRTDRLRKAARTALKMVKKLGVNVPAPLKSQLRRIF